MLYSNAKRIFCYNVTCFATNKSCSSRSHLSGCFKCPSLLACKAARVQLSTCVPISLSRAHLAASLYLFPADCFQEIMFKQARIFTAISLDFSDILSDISSLWAHESTSLDINKANGMLYSNAKRIFCYNVTCFATNKSCSSRSHLSGCFKCSSLLACKAARVQLSTCFPII